MPVYALSDELIFPPAEAAEPSGLLAVGGDLRPERVLLGYTQGIFPWYEDGYPILWHSPDPRFVLEVCEVHVPRSLRKVMRKRPFSLRLDTAFEAVITACRDAYRPGQRGTWITLEMVEAYTKLHEMGFAHSVEAWQGQQLVGGVYGVSLGHVFFGESMFARVSDASKVAFATFAEQLARWRFKLIDSQVYTDHMARFGAVEWERARYLRVLGELLRGPTRAGPWSFDRDLSGADQGPETEME